MRNPLLSTMIGLALLTGCGRPVFDEYEARYYDIELLEHQTVGDKWFAEHCSLRLYNGREAVRLSGGMYFDIQKATTSSTACQSAQRTRPSRALGESPSRSRFQGRSINATGMPNSSTRRTAVSRLSSTAKSSSSAGISSKRSAGRPEWFQLGRFHLSR